MNRTIAILTLALSMAPVVALAESGEVEIPTPSESSPAPAPEPSHHRASSSSSGGGGSFLGGKTLGSGDGIVAEFGWPGMSLGYLHGQGDLDLGGTFTFNYGYEGTPQIDPGIKLQGAIRLSLLDRGKLSLGLRLDPGLAMYFGRGFLLPDAFTLGITAPVGLALGVAVGDALSLHFGLDLPMTVFFLPGVFFELPILMGVGLEYRLDSHLSVLLDTRFGPDIFIFNNDPETTFAFRTLVGIGYRL